MANKISHEKAEEILQISPFDLVDIYLNLGIIYMLDWVCIWRSFIKITIYKFTE